MNFESVSKRLLIGVPTALVLSALISCPWLANRANSNRLAEHDLLVNKFVRNGCAVQKVLQIAVNPNGIETVISSESSIPETSKTAGSSSIVRGTQTFLECPPAMSQLGKTRWTVFSSCSAMLNPLDIAGQIALAPNELWRVADCSTDSIND